MKTMNLKNVTLTALMFTAFTLTAMSTANAQVQQQPEGTETRINLPAHASADPFSEGTETTLTAEQMGSIRAWAQNSKASLQDLLEKTQTETYRRTKEDLIYGIREVVLRSAPKSTELLLRYILNRSLDVVGEIDRLDDTSSAGVVDQEVRVLKRSIEMALEYYESDIAFLNSQNSDRIVALPYAKFGIRYVQFLMQVNESLVNSRVAYRIADKALGYLQVDLFKDESRNAYGTVITKLNDFLQAPGRVYPRTSFQAVNQMRQLRKIYNQALRSINQISVGN